MAATPVSSGSCLVSLNPAQLQAVEHPPSIPLQILAGPGSGKTKVLTSRIAHLILRHSIPPSSICAVTFTNKAANEMKARLQSLLGTDRVGELKMGTFHSLCAKFLRKYAHTIGLSDNFSICDADEAKKVVRQLLKPYAEFLAARDMTIKEELVKSKISNAKAKGTTADQFAGEVDERLRRKGDSLENMPSQDIQVKITGEVYREYEKLLRHNNAMDFDDLLLYGVRLFKQRREAVAWCEHVLVDEFQDTNIIQYDLMQSIAHKNCVTIVGDPDQSIYGWRSAEVANLGKMKKDFPGTKEIFLEENYRSTGSILRVSLAIIAEDQNRIQKSLHTSHPAGKTPTLRPCLTETDEANFIAVEIKRLVAYTGGLLQFDDFAILLRFNALSRIIESSLQKEGIPCRILGGHKFFERLEVKDLLAYLQLVDNPDFYPGVSRAINTPSRGIGEKTLLELGSKADQYRISHLAVLERIFDSAIPDTKPPVKRKISSFINTVRALRDLNQKRASPADILRQLLQMIDYMEHLKKTQPDWESRWENVQELINFATEVGADAQSTNPSEIPLRLFLQASSLSSEGGSDGNSITSKVTIATCHAAKGLEWPVVMIPAVEDGTFPFTRSDDIEEERRLLYVACTRAKGLLYLTHARRRRVAGQLKDVTQTSFVQSVFHKHPGIFTYQHPELDPDARMVLSNILRRQVPNEDEVARRIAEFNEVIRNRENSVDILDPSNAPPYNRPNTTPLLVIQSAASMALNSARSYPQQRMATERPVPSCKPLNRMLHFHAVQRTTPLSIARDTPNANNGYPVRTDFALRHDDSQSASASVNALSWSPSAIDGSLPVSLCEAPPTSTMNTSQYLPARGEMGSNQPASTKGDRLSTASSRPTVASIQACTSQSNDNNQQELRTDPVRPAKSESLESDISLSSPQSMVDVYKYGVKRRLGMGRVTNGYANKKFKLPC